MFHDIRLLMTAFKCSRYFTTLLRYPKIIPSCPIGFSQNYLQRTYYDFFVTVRGDRSTSSKPFQHPYTRKSPEKKDGFYAHTMTFS